jgi:hypothetical protein
MENILNFETLEEIETILCAAIYVNDLQVYAHQPKNIKTGFVISGYRHCCCLENIKLIYKEQSEFKKFENVQGFLTNHFNFVNRTEAFQIAKNSKQIISNLIFEDFASLTSEDLY